MSSGNDYNSQQPKKGLGGCAITLIVFFVFLVFSGIALIFLVGVGGSQIAKSLKDTKSSPYLDKYTEEVLEEGDSQARVLLIPLVGIIRGWGNYSEGAGMVQEIAAQLRAAAKDDTVRCVLIQVDSPGGGLTASDILYNEIKLFQESGKSVVVSIGNIAASGGYYIIAPADYIVANPTALIGSFGVIMQHFEVDEMLKKIGVVAEPIKSTGSKDILSPFRPMTEKERLYLESITQSYHDRFIDIITEGRSLEREDVKKLANGKIYTAEVALNNQLIDEIAYYDTAREKAVEFSGSIDPEIFTYRRVTDFADILKGFGANSSTPDIEKLLLEKFSTRLLLLYNGPDNK